MMLRMFPRYSLLVLLCFVLPLVACDVQEPEESAEGEVKPDLDQTATTLPLGVREGWFEALDRAIDQKLVTHRNWVQISNLFGSTAYVHINSLVAECGRSIETLSWGVGIGLSVAGGDRVFGGGLVLVHEQTARTNLPSKLWPEAVLAPTLGVGIRSPAARDLMAELCRHLIVRISGMTE